MTYTPTNWVDGATPLNRANMMKIENELALLDGGGGAPGAEIGYAEAQAQILVTVNNAAGAGAILSIGPLTYAAVPILIEFQTPIVQATLGEAVICNLWDGSTDLGRIVQLLAPAGTSNQVPAYGSRRLTPSAGSHTYQIRLWGTNGNSTSWLGQSAPTLPFSMRITLV